MTRKEFKDCVCGGQVSQISNDKYVYMTIYYVLMCLNQTLSKTADEAHVHRAEWYTGGTDW